MNGKRRAILQNPPVPDPYAAVAAAADGAEPGYARVAAGLRAGILDGSLAPGSWIRLLPAAERFGVSVQPVREALQALHGEGLVEIHPNRGAQVRGLDRTRLVHIYEIRAALESFMARRFAVEAGASDLRALERIQLAHDAAVEARDLPEVLRVNMLFHGAINGHGGNHEAMVLIRRHYGLSQSIRRLVGFSPAYWRVREDHHALLDAFRRRDATDAADLGARHVWNSLEDALTQLDLRGPKPRTTRSEVPALATGGVGA
jgi:DNA-binding GntR family transcriptional regulator